MAGRVTEQKKAADAFWRFSLALYSRPGVAAALVALQDREGHDVNLMLFALWFGAVQGGRLDAVGLAAIHAGVEPLATAVIAPLRGLRRSLRDAPDDDLQDLRRRLAALELAAERHAQSRLASAAPTAPAHGEDRLALAEGNFTLCLGTSARSAEAVVIRRALAALMQRPA